MIGIIGDQHFKDNLSYADYISDRRVAEKKAVLDFIVESFKDCQHVVFLGDNFNSKNNSSETNREFVEFLEKFGDKQLYLIAGNHEKKGNGKTAIDFIGEIKKDNWHVFTKPGTISIEEIACKNPVKLDFLPYMHKSELGAENRDDATRIIMNGLKGGDVLFAHHTISGSSWNGIKSESLMTEVVLPKDELEKRYKLIVGGHIHEPQLIGNTLVAGSLFTSEVGDIEKFIYILDYNLEKVDLRKIKVPCREIHKIENPTAEQLSSIPKESIVKVIVTNKAIDLEELRNQLQRFDASLIVEDFPNQRKKANIEEGAFDFSIESLLKLYAKEKDVDYEKLLSGLRIIND